MIIFMSLQDSANLFRSSKKLHLPNITQCISCLIALVVCESFMAKCVSVVPNDCKHLPETMRFFNWKGLASTDLLENSKEFEEIITSLNQDGSHLYKVRSPNKWFRRKFSLDLKDMNLRYEPKSKTSCLKKNKHNGTI